MRAPRFQAGQVLSASKLNKLADVADAGVRGRTGTRPVDAFQAVRVLVLDVKTLNHGARTLTCTLPGMTGTGGAEEFTVELPQVFTEASRAGVTFTYSGSDLNARTASAGSSEDQEITPPFVIGETIIAADLEEGTRLLFLGDGRMWAKIPA